MIIYFYTWLCNYYWLSHTTKHTVTHTIHNKGHIDTLTTNKKINDTTKQNKKIMIIMIITSTSDLQPSTVSANQLHGKSV